VTAESSDPADDPLTDRAELGAESGDRADGESGAGRAKLGGLAGVGVDLLEIERLERALERRPRLAQRLFTEAELAYAGSRARPGQHLAARFCAKEAVAKALGLEAWNFCDVEVVGTGGPPEVRLHGAAAERARAMGVQVSISLTHTGRDAAAVAVVA
jgi:holo-[acyl-carrier protein] synthase